MSELKPCPFCGQTGYLEYSQLYDQYTQVICNAATGGCGASGGGEEFDEGAAREWNTRHTPEGWQMVPAEPTEQMRDAFNQQHSLHYNPSGEKEFRPLHTWKAMLQAAPSPDQGERDG